MTALAAVHESTKQLTNEAFSKQALEGTPAQENGEAVTRFKSKLPAIRSIFVIGRKAI